LRKHNRRVSPLLESLGQAIGISRRKKREGGRLIMNHAPELPAVDGPGSHGKEIEDEHANWNPGSTREARRREKSR